MLFFRSHFPEMLFIFSHTVVDKIQTYFGFNCTNDIHAINNFSEDNVFAIQPIGDFGTNEELGA